MNIRAVDFVMLPVSELKRAVGFYRDVLGLPLEIFSEEHQWAEFNCGNITLALKGGAQGPELSSGARLALAVADINSAYRELSARGGITCRPPQDHGCCRHLEVTDPDGHVVILHQRADGTCG